jgi:hypothetical protein
MVNLNVRILNRQVFNLLWDIWENRYCLSIFTICNLYYYIVLLEFNFKIKKNIEIDENINILNININENNEMFFDFLKSHIETFFMSIVNIKNCDDENNSQKSAHAIVENEDESPRLVIDESPRLVIGESPSGDIPCPSSHPPALIQTSSQPIKKRRRNCVSEENILYTKRISKKRTL